MSDININNEMVARIVILVRQQMEVLSPSSRDLDLPATFDQICLEFPKLAADDDVRSTSRIVNCSNGTVECRRPSRSKRRTDFIGR